jgi:hypothetical protein
LSSRRDLLLSLPVYAVILERSERGSRVPHLRDSFIAVTAQNNREYVVLNIATQEIAADDE